MKKDQATRDWEKHVEGLTRSLRRIQGRLSRCEPGSEKHRRLLDLRDKQHDKLDRIQRGFDSGDARKHQPQDSESFYWGVPAVPKSRPRVERKREAYRQFKYSQFK